MRLILASASPRRVDLLRQIGIEVDVWPCDLPEQRAVGESPLAYNQRVAREKARAGWERAGADPRRHALGADTEVVLDDRVYGKPGDAAGARAMLESLSGRTHMVLSSVAVYGADIDAVLTSTSTVRFACLDAATLAAYVAGGEPQGRAGGYAIGGFAACFIEHLEGSFSGVMGLPLHETSLLLKRIGIDPLG
ncbi:MAG: septum formation protein Maf [Xanthomonadales bacterium]|nr:Maf-like protein YhdE [Xanthomonadales bacterium]MCC6593802.1 septum formation protein Maf [Xanthomonadales bacterium]MCE7931742.1 septum formation protein Maf [Xanthomonadales bacterium PRO6]